MSSQSHRVPCRVASLEFFDTLSGTEEVPLRHEVARVEEEGDAQLVMDDARPDTHSH